MKPQAAIIRTPHATHFMDPEAILSSWYIYSGLMGCVRCWDDKGLGIFGIDERGAVSCSKCGRPRGSAH